MSSTVSVALAARQALRDAIIAAVDDQSVTVRMGAPTPADMAAGTSLDIIAVGGMSFTMEQGPLGSQRARNEYLTLAALVRVDRPDDPDEEQVTARVGVLVDAIELHLRTVDPYLGGTVQQCDVSAGEFYTDPWTADTTLGRTLELELTFTAWQRVQAI